MTTPVCFIDANNLKPDSVKKVLGWTVSAADAFAFGSALVLNGTLMYVANWFFVVEAVKELKEGEPIKTPYIEVWLVDEAEYRRRQLNAARQSGGAGLVGANGAALGQLDRMGIKPVVS